MINIRLARHYLNQAAAGDIDIASSDVNNKGISRVTLSSIKHPSTDRGGNNNSSSTGLGMLYR
jgi:hypothetical protein